LQLFLLYLLLRGPLRRFVMVFLYSAVYLGVTIVEEFVFHEVGRDSALYRTLYWTDEIALDLLLFLLVIVLTYQALEGSPIRAVAGRMLGGVVVAALVLPFVLFYRYELFSTRWLNGATQILNFGAAVMNMALWTALIGNKKRDRQLLTVSAGLGVAVAGAAIGFGLRQFTVAGGGAREVVNLLLLPFIHVVGVFIWCWAFRPRAARA
jgi:hypothetical protein